MGNFWNVTRPKKCSSRSPSGAHRSDLGEDLANGHFQDIIQQLSVEGGILECLEDFDGPADGRLLSNQAHQNVRNALDLEVNSRFKPMAGWSWWSLKRDLYSMYYCT